MIFKRAKTQAKQNSGWETSRLSLEPYKKEDYSQWADVREASRSLLQPFEPIWADDVLTKTAFERRVAFNYLQQDQGLAYCLLAHRKEDHKIVCGVNLTQIKKTPSMNAAWIGYWCGAPYLRQGYVYEALSKLISIAFHELDIHRLQASCMPCNTPSLNLLKKVGFQEEGLARDYLKINGEWVDQKLFSLLKTDICNSEKH